MACLRRQVALQSVLASKLFGINPVAQRLPRLDLSRLVLNNLVLHHSNLVGRLRRLLPLRLLRNPHSQAARLPAQWSVRPDLPLKRNPRP